MKQNNINPFDEDKDDHDDGFGIGFSDTLANLCSILIILLALVLLLPKEEQRKVDSTSNPGQICAELSWPDSRNVDLDLWSRSPDGSVTGYSNPHTGYMDLMRDVVGFKNNPSHRNFEIMCGKQLLPGEWSFNVLYYGKDDTEQIEVPTSLTVTMKHSLSDSPVILSADFQMTFVKQEKTIFNFRLDETGALIADSVNSRNVSIVTRK